MCVPLNMSMIILRHVVWMHNGPHPVMQLEDDAAFMDKYSRQIGAFGLEAMSKLMNLKVLIVGLRYVFVACVRPRHIPMFCSYKQPASTKSNFFFTLFCCACVCASLTHRTAGGKVSKALLPTATAVSMSMGEIVAAVALTTH